MTKQKDMKLTNWLMCILAIAAVVLSVLIYLKVNKKCERQKYTPSNMRRIRPRGRKVGFDILPSNPFTVGNMSPDMVALCNQSQLNSNQYFCDNIYDASQGTTQGANTVDPTDNDLFCVGNAALANDPTDGSTVYIGMCSKPITYGVIFKVQVYVVILPLQRVAIMVLLPILAMDSHVYKREVMFYQVLVRVNSIIFYYNRVVGLFQIFKIRVIFVGQKCKAIV